MGSIVTYTYKSKGTHKLTIPEGYAEYALVYAWGAGGGLGTNVKGGSGGFAFAAIPVATGDELLIAVGGGGGRASGTSGGTYGEGLILKGSVDQTFTNSTIVNHPSKVEYGFFTRTAHANSNAFSGIREYYITYQGNIVYQSSTKPPTTILQKFKPGTYRGSIYSYAIGGPGGGDNLNHFDLIADDSVSLRGGKGGDGRDEDSDSFGAGGGGGATAVLLNNEPRVVAAGGGGGGGAGDDNWKDPSKIAYPGGDYPGSESISPWYPVSDGRWGSFINTYGIWRSPTGGTKEFTARLYFPDTGTYTFTVSSDNNASWRVDSGTTYTTSFTAFSGSSTQSISLSAGYHTITATIYNPGDVGGWAMRVTKPDTTELWHTRKPSHNSGLNIQPQGEDGHPGGGGSGAGGGGYPYGGAAGRALGDDQPASYGGNGGQNYVYPGNIVVSGTAIIPIVEAGTRAGIPGGRDSEYWPGVTAGYPGNDGAVVVILTKSFRAWVKHSGSWKAVNDAWVKVSGEWKRILKGWIKANGEWKALESDITDTMAATDELKSDDRININLYYDGLSEDDANVLVVTNNINVLGEVIRSGYEIGKTTVTVTIDANAVIGSTSVTTPALTVSGFGTGDQVNIINNGTISGADTTGNAVLAENSVTITNNGTIEGGSPDGYYISGNSYVTWNAIGTVTGNTD